ncbi:MAG: DUF58 domain-containing protein [Candidatus Heimdallarchaeota archaeon]|nr:DUF58 domain-containing protein [Candidatus Heimdallarchaeota archaeon]
MDLSEHILKPYWFVIISLVLALVTFNFNWLIVPFIVILSIVVRFNQKDSEFASLEIERIVNGSRFKESDLIRVKFRIHNSSKYTFRGEIVDKLPEDCILREGSNISLLKIEPGEYVDISYVISFFSRGQYILGPVETFYHTLGEYHYHHEVHDLLRQVLIVPIPDPVSKYSLPPAFLTVLGGSFRSKLVGDGIDFAGIREYQIGDTFRRINWKQTAKYGTLYSNEFEINRASNFIIAIDLTDEDKEISDLAVRAALGLAAYLMNYRCKVGLVTIGEYFNYIPPKTGKLHMIEMTEHLTMVKSIPKISNMDLLKVRIRDGVKRLAGDNNEIILFSSLQVLEKAMYTSEQFLNKGTLSIFSPTGISTIQEGNPFMSFAKKIVEVRNAVISNYMLKKHIKIYEWVPGYPFDLSIAQWRYKR